MSKELNLTQENIDALCGKYNYQEKIQESQEKGGIPTIVSVDNPESREEFAYRKVIDLIGQITKNNIIDTARTEAEKSAIEAADKIEKPTFIK